MDNPAVEVIERIWLAVPGVWMESLWTTPNATADIFEPDVLTITSATDGTIRKVFDAAHWVEAHVYQGDRLAFSFNNRSLAAGALALVNADPRERRAS